MTIRVTVWGENVHEQKNKVVAEVYPKTMHGTIAEALNRDKGIKATTVTLQDAEHGMTKEKLAETDVLIWWGHAAHGAVDDKIVERVCDAVWGGMGVIFLHSAHFSKPFKRLMGAPVQPDLARGGRAGTAVGDQPPASDCAGAAGSFRTGIRGNVWRALWRAGTA